MACGSIGPIVGFSNSEPPKAGLNGTSWLLVSFTEIWGHFLKALELLPTLKKWRRERDSNPRKDYSFTGLANLRFRPLSHLSDAAEIKRHSHVQASKISGDARLSVHPEAGGFSLSSLGGRRGTGRGGPSILQSFPSPQPSPRPTRRAARRAPRRASRTVAAGGAPSRQGAGAAGGARENPPADYGQTNNFGMHGMD